MPDWENEASIEKNYKMRRAMSQEIGHRMKTDDLQRIFPEKKINGKDISETYRSYGYKIITDFDTEKDMQHALQFMLLRFYEKGIDLDENRKWKWVYFLCMQSTAQKIDKMTDITKLAFMDSTEKIVEEEVDKSVLFG